jgi:hypothetical protein
MHFVWISANFIAEAGSDTSLTFSVEFEEFLTIGPSVRS